MTMAQLIEWYKREDETGSPRAALDRLAAALVETGPVVHDGTLWKAYGAGGLTTGPLFSPGMTFDEYFARKGNCRLARDVPAPPPSPGGRDDALAISGGPTMPVDEVSYGRGQRDAWSRMLAECLAQLGVDDPEAGKARWASERADVVAMLRQVCDEWGDNDWEDSLNLADVIEKHLWRHLPDETPDPERNDDDGAD